MSNAHSCPLCSQQLDSFASTEREVFLCRKCSVVYVCNRCEEHVKARPAA